MKKLILGLFITVPLLTACANSGTGTNNELSKQLLTKTISYQCQSKLPEQRYFNLATAVLSATQKQQLQDTICECIADKAPEHMDLTDLAKATVDEQFRSELASKVVKTSLKSCATDALNNAFQ